MKRILSTLVLLSFLAVLFLPVTVLAQEKIPDECILRHDLKSINSFCAENATVSVEEYGMCCIMNAIYTVTDWVFVVLLGIAVIMIIWGGFVFRSAGGDPEKVKKGQGFVVYAVVGIGVALLAKLIPSVVKFMLGL